MSDAGGTDTVGEALLGAAILLGAGAIRTLLPPTWTTLQQTHRSRPAVTVDGQALGSRTADRTRRDSSFAALALLDATRCHKL